MIGKLDKFIKKCVNIYFNVLLNNNNNKFIKIEVLLQFLSTIINLSFLILSTAFSLKPTKINQVCIYLYRIPFEEINGLMGLEVYIATDKHFQIHEIHGVAGIYYY